MAIKPTIEDGKVTSIEVGNIRLSLKKDISLNDLPKVIEGLDYLSQYIDFSIKTEADEPRGEWSRDEVFTFLDKRNEQQITFFRIVEDAGAIRRDNLVNEMGKRLKKSDFKGLTLAGILSGIGIRRNRLNKERLYEKNRKVDGTYYSISKKYAPIIKAWLETNS